MGIDSISLTPDSVLRAIDIVSKAEMKDSLAKEIDGAISFDKAQEEAKGKDEAKNVGVWEEGLVLRVLEARKKNRKLQSATLAIEL